MSRVFCRPISYTKRLSLAAGYYIVISCSKWESLCIRNWSAKACYNITILFVRESDSPMWYLLLLSFFINKDYKKSCEQMSLFPLVLWAYALWAFVLWAFVLWAFVMESGILNGMLDKTKRHLLQTSMSFLVKFANVLLYVWRANCHYYVCRASKFQSWDALYGVWATTAG